MTSALPSVPAVVEAEMPAVLEAEVVTVLEACTGTHGAPTGVVVAILGRFINEFNVPLSALPALRNSFNLLITPPTPGMPPCCVVVVPVVLALTEVSANAILVVERANAVAITAAATVFDNVRFFISVQTIVTD
jgi:hypothetical protein